MVKSMTLVSDVTSDASACAVVAHPALGIQSTTTPVYGAPIDGTRVPSADRKVDVVRTAAVTALPVFQGSPPRGAPV